MQLNKNAKKNQLEKKLGANRKRLPKRDVKIYKKVVKKTEKFTYLDGKLRLTLCILAIV